MSDPGAPVDTSADPTPPRPPRPTGPVQYKGEDLEPERGPGLGCFRIQLAVLFFLIVLTPLSVVWRWPAGASAVLLFVVIFLLLITGQTIIFLLRLVAADRRGRRRPLASGTKTVGELEDEAAGEPATSSGTATAAVATAIGGTATALDVETDPSPAGLGMVGDEPPDAIGDEPPDAIGDEPPDAIGDEPPDAIGDEPPDRTTPPDVGSTPP